MKPWSILLSVVTVGSLAMAVLVTFGAAVASSPVSAYAEVERARRCSASDAGITVCAYEFERPYKFALKIERVGTSSPVISVEASNVLIFPRVRVGAGCVEIVSVYRPTAGISLATGAFYRTYADCEREAEVRTARDGG